MRKTYPELTALYNTWWWWILCVTFGSGGAEGRLLWTDCWTFAWNESSVSKLGFDEILEKVASSEILGSFETAAAIAAEATLEKLIGKSHIMQLECFNFTFFLDSIRREIWNLPNKGIHWLSIHLLWCFVSTFQVHDMMMMLKMYSRWIHVITNESVCGICSCCEHNTAIRDDDMTQSRAVLFLVQSISASNKSIILRHWRRSIISSIVFIVLNIKWINIIDLSMIWNRRDKTNLSKKAYREIEL